MSWSAWLRIIYRCVFHVCVSYYSAPGTVTRKLLTCHRLTAPRGRVPQKAVSQCLFLSISKATIIPSCSQTHVTGVPIRDHQRADRTVPTNKGNLSLYYLPFDNYYTTIHARAVATARGPVGPAWAARGARPLPRRRSHWHTLDTLPPWAAASLAPASHWGRLRKRCDVCATHARRRGRG